MENLQHLLERNRQWADKVKKEKPDLFKELAQQQTPKYLWIGCSDSRVPANQITDLPPGEIFVHRNIANLVVEDDENCLSVLQYAVEALDIDHIIVCGHYGCGGVQAALQQSTVGYIDKWLGNLRNLADKNSDRLEGLEFSKKHDLMCELNVHRQVKNICSTDLVQQAWQNGSFVAVHGLIYSLKDGVLKELQPGVTSNEELNSLGN